ncbi:unnamed protein product [Leptidea sinapis]|uniref:Uncharacterized protein n=1 Tax=Leptidea sinapis TaxID=189913 RepID=A0A5E4QDF7_9NEOP|nr:unnamed protein product [Leptidea sinapis]
MAEILDVLGWVSEKSSHLHLTPLTKMNMITKNFHQTKEVALDYHLSCSDLAAVQAFQEYKIDNYLLGILKAKRLFLLHFRRKLADTLNFVQQNECCETRSTKQLLQEDQEW